MLLSPAGITALHDSIIQMRPLQSICNHSAPLDARIGLGPCAEQCDSFHEVLRLVLRLAPVGTGRCVCLAMDVMIKVHYLELFSMPVAETGDLGDAPNQVSRMTLGWITAVFKHYHVVFLDHSIMDSMLQTIQVTLVMHWERATDGP